ncbi:MULTISPECIES: hypothetical protein [unclassified Streptomyces]|uniref:hypothetical protein n=1 Tax=unclassified Streptomyces TaxID=2593676 RepID=UPI00381DFAD9
MLHEIEDLELERSRTSERPEASSAPPVLTHFDLAVEVPGAEYAIRLRSVMNAVLTLAMSEEFEDDDFPVDTMPAWFSAVCREGDGPVEEFARTGSLHYTEKTGSKPWALRSWLYRFDPEVEVRGWSWWDLTSLPNGGLRLWADTWGEPFFSWEDLRWLLYACGAAEVEGPILNHPEVWAAEDSV